MCVSAHVHMHAGSWTCLCTTTGTSAKRHRGNWNFPELSSFLSHPPFSSPPSSLESGVKRDVLMGSGWLDLWVVCCVCVLATHDTALLSLSRLPLDPLSWRCVCVCVRASVSDERVDSKVGVRCWTFEQRRREALIEAHSDRR